MSKIYISGAITGLPEGEVKRKFYEAEQLLRQKGYDVVNPTTSIIPSSAPFEVHLAFDIITLLGCSAIYMLADWQSSKGATIENSVAKITGKDIFYEVKPISVALKQAIGEVVGLSYSDLLGPCRNRDFVYARMIYAWLRREKGATVTDISEEMNRNHSTVIYYFKKFDDETKYNKKFSAMVSDVKAAIARSEMQQY
jgi:hypothetical protein